jgi:hypothetical protein
VPHTSFEMSAFKSKCFVMHFAYIVDWFVRFWAKHTGDLQSTTAEANFCIGRIFVREDIIFQVVF